MLLSEFEEHWSEIEGYPGYEVSNYGEVISIKTGDSLVQKKMANGALKVRLFKDGKRTGVYVHDLVAAAFFENYVPGMKVSHRNKIKTDNSVLNLTLAEDA